MAKQKAENKIEKVAQEVSLNPIVWEVPYNADLIAQVLYVMRSNARQGNANAKRRSDVSGGGRKPWKQKGTGRARAGSNRSPLWAKGGVTFVPNFRNWARKINKKMRKLAVRVLLSDRLRKNSIEFVTIDSNSDMKALRSMFINNTLAGKHNLIVTENEKVSLSLRNIEKITVVNGVGLNAFALALSKKVLIDKESVNVIEKNLLNEN